MFSVLDISKWNKDNMLCVLIHVLATSLLNYQHWKYCLNKICFHLLEWAIIDLIALIQSKLSRLKHFLLNRFSFSEIIFYFSLYVDTFFSVTPTAYKLKHNQTTQINQLHLFNKQLAQMSSSRRATLSIP